MSGAFAKTVRENRAFTERELRSMGSGRGVGPDDLGAEVALFAGVSPKGSNRGADGGGFARQPPPGAFSMPGVSAIPGVDGGAAPSENREPEGAPGGVFAVAPLEREGRAGSKRFTLE